MARANVMTRGRGHGMWSFVTVAPGSQRGWLPVILGVVRDGEGWPVSPDSVVHLCSLSQLLGPAGRRLGGGRLHTRPLKPLPRMRPPVCEPCAFQNLSSHFSEKAQKSSAGGTAQALSQQVAGHRASRAVLRLRLCEPNLRSGAVTQRCRLTKRSSADPSPGNYMTVFHQLRSQPLKPDHLLVTWALETLPRDF